jgi:hypothetical protein
MPIWKSKLSREGNVVDTPRETPLKTGILQVILKKMQDS